MASKASALLLLPFLLLSLASAFNITNILNQHPDLSAFNSLLTQTKLADQINGRTTITVLAVDQAGLSAANGLPQDVLKRVLSVHVILDYYDTAKIQSLNGTSISLTTLFQTTGTADQRQGFLNMTKDADGKVAFGSAMPGSPVDSDLVKSVMSKPYNISVLQVSSVIVPPGLTNENTNKTHTPPPSPLTTAPTPSPSKDKKAATPPSKTPAAATPATAPAADAPAADAPAADSPAAGGPAADSPTGDDSSEDQESGAGQVAVGAGAGVSVMVMGALLLLGL